MKIPTEPKTPALEGTRRKFLGTSAVAAGAAALPTSISAQVEGNSTLKLALVGCGGRGSGAANQNLTTQGTKLVAMADVFEDRMNGALDSLTKRHADKVEVPDENKFIGFDAYLKAIEVADVVILATPPGFRPMMFKAAIDAGKHVFMEKPVCVDAAGYRMVMEAAKKADEKNLKVVVGLQRHYQKSYLETLDRVKNGMIGDIVSAQIYWNGGGVWVRDRQPDDTEMRYQCRNWYYFNWLCGDNICEQHIHNIDVANWFIGEAMGKDFAHPISAQGMGGREVRDGDPKYGQIFDHHFVEFRYENGVIVNSQCRHQRNTWSRVSEEIIGTNGRAEPGKITDRTGKKVMWRHRGRDDENPYQVEHNVLLKHIREDKPINNAYYGATSSMTSVFGRMCTYSGKNLKWDDAIKSEKSDFPDVLAWDAQPKVLPGPDGQYPVPVPGVTEVI